MSCGKFSTRCHNSAGVQFDVKDVLTTQDPVKLSFARDVLAQAGIESVVLDSNTASVFGGGVVFVQQRLAVLDEDAAEAKALLDKAFADAERGGDGVDG